MKACQDQKADLLLLRNASDWSEALGEDLKIDAVFDSQGVLTRRFNSGPRQSSGHIILTTSGTTGEPKMVTHTLASLSSSISVDLKRGAEESWLMTYHPASFAGLQVLLTSLAQQAALIAPLQSNLQGLTAAFIKHNPTHVSGTPSFWRGLLMALSECDYLPSLEQITLGGELTDQATINLLKITFPKARIIHIYATTEAGVVFTVRDDLAGFPASWIEEGVNGIQLRINANQLEINRQPTMPGTKEEDGANWISTGDLVEQQGERFYFKGRADGVINVGGSKVNPEEIEAILLSHPSVADAHVFGKRNPIVGSLVSAEIMLSSGTGTDHELLKEELRQFSLERLAAHQIPRMIEFVTDIKMNSTGKKHRTS